MNAFLETVEPEHEECLATDRLLEALSSGEQNLAVHYARNLNELRSPTIEIIADMMEGRSNRIFPYGFKSQSRRRGRRPKLAIQSHATRFEQVLVFLANGDPKSAASALRQMESLSKAEVQQFADLMDNDADAPTKLTLNRSRRGRHADYLTSRAFDFSIWRIFQDLPKGQTEAEILDIQESHKLSRATIHRALSRERARRQTQSVFNSGI